MNRNLQALADGLRGHEGVVIQKAFVDKTFRSENDSWSADRTKCRSKTKIRVVTNDDCTLVSVCAESGSRHEVVRVRNILDVTLLEHRLDRLIGDHACVGDPLD